MDNKILDAHLLGYDSGMRTCLNLARMLQNNVKGISGEELYLRLRDIIFKIVSDLRYNSSEDEVEELRSLLIEE